MLRVRDWYWRVLVSSMYVLVPVRMEDRTASFWLLERWLGGEACSRGAMFTRAGVGVGGQLAMAPLTTDITWGSACGAVHNVRGLRVDRGHLGLEWLGGGRLRLGWRGLWLLGLACWVVWGAVVLLVRVWRLLGVWGVLWGAARLCAVLGVGGPWMVGGVMGVAASGVRGSSVVRWVIARVGVVLGGIVWGVLGVLVVVLWEWALLVLMLGVVGVGTGWGVLVGRGVVGRVPVWLRGVLVILVGWVFFPF